MEVDTPPDEGHHETSVRQNIRDIADVTSLLKPGMMFRSSFMHSLEVRKRHGIVSVLDLRSASRECKKQSRVMKEMTRPDWMWARARSATLQATSSRNVPSCPNCQAQFSSEEEGICTKVYHVDMCTMAFKAKVFGNVPRHVQFQAIGRALTLRSAEPVVSKAVADKDAFGYGLLYVLFLEHSKRKVAKIFSVLSNEANYPLLVHCTHGKDRTGLSVMLVLRLCGVDYETIIKEYMFSERTMTSWNERKDLPLQAHMTTTPILSIERQYMEEAINHIKLNYEDVPKYLHSCGVTDEQQQVVKAILAGPDASSHSADSSPGTIPAKAV